MYIAVKIANVRLGVNKTRNLLISLIGLQVLLCLDRINCVIQRFL